MALQNFMNSCCLHLKNGEIPRTVENPQFQKKTSNLQTKFLNISCLRFSKTSLGFFSYIWTGLHTILFSCQQIGGSSCENLTCTPTFGLLSKREHLEMADDTISGRMSSSYEMMFFKANNEFVHDFNPSDVKKKQSDDRCK